MIRMAGYALSAIVAGIFYVSWIAVEVGGTGSLRDRLFAALFFCVFGGFSAALMFMILPWILAVWIFHKVRLQGTTYFACAGALAMIVFGCIAFAISPEPLFVEDHTFLEGVSMVLTRQGLCLVLAGTIMGLAYWFFVERRFTGSRRDRLKAVT